MEKKVHSATWLLPMIVIVLSCSTKTNEVIDLPFQKDLIPEGIAIDPESRTIFLNSLRLRKIVTCKLDGSDPRTFVDSAQYHYLPGFGMLIKGDTLFALGNTLPRTNSRSILLLLNKNTGALLKSYAPYDTTFKYLNDLAVCRNNDVYITDSESNKIYTINHKTDSLAVYLDSPEVGNSNGIAVSDDNRYLYLASNAKGIRIVELTTKRIVNESDLDYIGIDGMKYYKNSLFAIVSDGVLRFRLNKENNAIVSKEKLLTFDKTFNSTTFSILDGYLYFTINSQLGNFNDKTYAIIDEKKLQGYKMMKLKID